jgi:hypothetical protein
MTVQMDIYSGNVTAGRGFQLTSRIGRISNLRIGIKHENSCGAASDGSPRREPWEMREKLNEPRKGRKNNPYPRSIAAPRLDFLFVSFARLTPWATISRHSVADMPANFETNLNEMSRY